MITPTANQITILESERKRVSWLFVITTGDGLTTYYWSTRTRSYGGQAYAAKVLPDSFNGITMAGDQTELGIQGVTDLIFRAPNKNNTLIPADFVDGTVIVRYLLAAAGLEEIFRSWKFKIRSCYNLQQHLSFSCVDILQDALEGHYPLTPLVKDIFLSKNTDQDASVCVPLPVGTAYVLLRPVYAGGEFAYLLGPDDGAYTVEEVRSPRSWGPKQAWPVADYPLVDTQSVKTDALSRDWKVLAPKIAKSYTGLSAPDVTGFWPIGDRFMDIPVKYSWDVTSWLTNPANYLEFVLTDSTYGMGIASADWNAAAQATAAAAYAGWTLTWNGALDHHEEKEKVITRLLGMCHSVLDSGETIALRVLTGASQATITDAVVRRGTDKKSTFAARPASSRKNPDGGYLMWQEAGEAQDEFYKSLVPVVSGGAPVRPSSEVFACPWVGNSQLAQKLAIMNFQRRFQGAGECSFIGKRGMAGFYGVMLQTNDVLAVNEASYGGTYQALIKSMTIRRDGAPEFQCMILSAPLADIGAIAAGALTYTEPTTQIGYRPVMSGPLPAGDPAGPPNQADGDIILPRGASVLLSGGGAIKNNGRGSDFEISEDVGLLAKGVGVNLAAIMSSAYESAPLQWFSEASFAEVAITAPYSPPGGSKTQFYSDAFKANITGNLTVVDAADNGDTWTITFTGATLTADRQVGNMIEPDWVVIWYKYLEIVANGADWVEIVPASLAGEVYWMPDVGETFSIHGVYANSIMTYRAPFSLWWTAGGNIAEESVIGSVNTTTGLVSLIDTMPNYILLGDRFKAWDTRVLFEFGWNNRRVVLAPSDHCPDVPDLYLGAGGSHPGTQFRYIYLRATDGLYVCPTYNVHDKTAHVASGYPGYRAHLQVDKGNLTLADGYLAIKEGISEPAAVTGQALIYIDVADSLWKIKFSNGTVKKIAFVGPE